MSHVYERLPARLLLAFKAFCFVRCVSVQIWPTAQLHQEKTSRSVFICWLNQGGETDPTTTLHNEPFAAESRLKHQATMLASKWEPGAGPEKTQTIRPSPVLRSPRQLTTSPQSCADHTLAAWIYLWNATFGFPHWWFFLYSLTTAFVFAPSVYTGEPHKRKT